jgi:hypothetical protein
VERLGELSERTGGVSGESSISSSFLGGLRFLTASRLLWDLVRISSTAIVLKQITLYESNRYSKCIGWSGAKMHGNIPRILGIFLFLQ